jgi:predicted esterase
VAVLVCLPAVGRAQDAPPPASWPRGEIIAEVPTAADPRQSYALYLPPNYDPARPWPLIFALDPAARGRVPVEQLRPAAEKYGYIVVGSNNSRNGPLLPQTQAFQAMWNDVMDRFAVDEQRIYAAGFSGGARLATLMGHQCGGCIAGVLSSGGGFAPSVPVTAELPFVFFSALGQHDFLYAEVVELLEKLDAAGVPYALRSFEGGHQWAPPEVLTEGVEWLEVTAMGRGRRPPDDAFIEAQWRTRETKARALEERRSWLEAYRTYKEMESAFAGLRDVSDVTAKIRALRESKEFRAALKDQGRAVEKQLLQTRPIAEHLAALREASPDRSALAAAVRSRVADLRRRRESEKDPQEVATLRRSLGYVFALYFESGEGMLRANDYATALLYFQVAAEAVPRSPGVDYNIACAYARSGRAKEALAALRRAVEKGFTDAALLKSDPDLDSLRELPEFQQLQGSLPPP